MSLRDVNPLRSFRWYRRMRGGRWMLVAPWPALPYISPFWTRSACEIEKVLQAEDYRPAPADARKGGG